MGDESQVLTTLPASGQLDEWSAAVEQAVESLKGNKVEAANLAADAVQFLSVAHGDLGPCLQRHPRGTHRRQDFHRVGQLMVARRETRFPRPQSSPQRLTQETS